MRPFLPQPISGRQYFLGLNMKEDRKKVWVHSFQTKLFVRIAAYWLLYQITLWNFLFVGRLLSEGPGNIVDQFLRFSADFYPMWIAFALLVPVMAWDAMRFTHRLVGPLYRIQRTVQKVADAEPVHHIHLREGDYLLDLKDEFNRMLDTLQREGAPVLKPTEPIAVAPKQQTA